VHAPGWIDPATETRVPRLKITHVVVLLAALLAPAASGGTASASAPMRIGMVADTNSVYDRSFNELAYAGVRTAALKLGAYIDVRASPTALSYEPNLRFMAQQGYDLVIAIGPAEEQALADVASDYPDVRFAIVNDSYAAPVLGSLPNVLGLRFQQQEAGYLAGYLAGLVELSRMPRLKAGNVISSIGGVRGPSVDRYLAGFQAGALAADPKVRLLHTYTNTDASVARCHTLALSQIAAGSDIVFPVAGACNTGALQAVAEKGVWALGVDADRSYLGASVLASAALRVDQAVMLAIYAVHDGTFAAGRDVEFGIAQNALGIAGINVAVPGAIRARLNAVANRLRAGRISVPTALAPLSR
jgi:basic membrane protein A and related proteins